jgi:glycine oxidase
VFEAALDAQAADHLDLLLAARDLWPELAARSGVVLDRSGAAAVGSDAWLAKVRGRLAGLDVRGADLPRAMLEALAPGVAPGLEAVLVREDWRLDPRPSLAALRQAGEAAGVAFRTEAVTERGDADWLVAATGAGQGLAREAPELARLSPIKGQILRFAGVGGGPLSLRGEACYAAGGADGLAVGATMEPGRDDAQVDPVALRPLVEAAGRLFPGLKGASYAASAGVRAATPDGLPLVGRSRTPGVILAAGARRNGWLLAPLVARLVTACVMGRDAGPYATRLDPRRFEEGAA